MFASVQNRAEDFLHRFVVPAHADPHGGKVSLPLLALDAGEVEQRKIGNPLAYLNRLRAQASAAVNPVPAPS